MENSTNFSTSSESIYSSESLDFKNTVLYDKIHTATIKHKNQQLNFRFKPDQILKIMDCLSLNPTTEKIISSAFQEALEKSDKRPMVEQLDLKKKYQKTHGLVFKDIPNSIKRSDIYDAIMKLGRTVDPKTGGLMFPGGCKLRSFFFPESKKINGKSENNGFNRVCFPIFVNKRDQMYIYNWSQNQGGYLFLGQFENWNGCVKVELTRQEIENPQTVSKPNTVIRHDYQHISMPMTVQPYFNPYFVHN